MGEDAKLLIRGWFSDAAIGIVGSRVPRTAAADPVVLMAAAGLLIAVSIAALIQRESVAGIRAVPYGRFHYMDRPRRAFWTGTAAYRIRGGVLTVRLPEGGVLSLVEDQDGVRLAHNVYTDVPDSLWGRFCLWLFQSCLTGRQALYEPLTS